MTKPRSAFLTLDALAGLFLLAALATALAVGATLRQKSAQHLADQRIANSLAERALFHLQSTGQQLTVPATEISVSRTGQRVGRLEWVEVSVLYNTRHAAITGLAPATQPGGSE